MTWIRFDDDFTNHPKLAELGVLKPMAGWLHVCAMAWSNHYLRDGVIPWGQVGRLENFDHIGYEVAGDSMSAIGKDVDPHELAEALVAVGVWERHEDGYCIHDYLKYQPSRESVETQRGALHDARSNAGKAGAFARWGDGKSTQVNDGKMADGITNSMANAWQADGPVPVPKEIDIKTNAREDGARQSSSREVPHPVLASFEQKVRRDARPDEVCSLLSLCRKFGKDTTTRAIGQAAVQGEPDSFGLITTIAKAEKGAQ